MGAINWNNKKEKVHNCVRVCREIFKAGYNGSDLILEYE